MDDETSVTHLTPGLTVDGVRYDAGDVRALLRVQQGAQEIYGRDEVTNTARPIELAAALRAWEHHRAERERVLTAFIAEVRAVATAHPFVTITEQRRTADGSAGE